MVQKPAVILENCGQQKTAAGTEPATV